ncbi:bacteriocin [Companilactobacillus musae]|nr:bacteriocin [Companilactobacillus musae]
MKKNISEKELSTISGGKARMLMGAMTSKGIIRNVIKWIKH